MSSNGGILNNNRRSGTDYISNIFYILRKRIIQTKFIQGALLPSTGLSGLRSQILDNAAVESHLKIILKAIHEIFNQNASHLSFEMLYRYCYQLVLSKQGKKITKYVYHR